MIRRCIASLGSIVVVLFAARVASAQQGLCVPGQCPPVQGVASVTVPSAKYPTVQSGIDALATGGILKLRAGTYVESLRIAGKTVAIAGQPKAGAKPEIVAPSGDVPVVTFGENGGGSLANVVLRGGAYGVLSQSDTQTWTPDVTLTKVDVRDVGRGVYGAFGKLQLERSTVTGARWNGLSVLAARALLLQNTTVADCGHVGLLIFNDRPPAGGPWIALLNSSFNGNANGGIAIHGRYAPVTMMKVKVVGNGFAAVALYDADAFMTQCDLSGSTPLTVDGAPMGGIGVLALRPRQVTVLNSTLAGNVLTAVSALGCDPSDARGRVTLGFDDLSDSLMDLAVGRSLPCDGGSIPEFEDAGGVTCATGGTAHDCSASASVLEPIDVTGGMP